MPTPDELRTFSELAQAASEDYLIMARDYPNYREYYLKCASDRKADAEFWMAKADRDEARIQSYSEQKDAA